jgi:hypothetical protein
LSKSDIARKILTYLANHPDAQDTIDGIVQWWLPEQEIKYELGILKEIISELVREKILLVHKSTNSRVHYRINRKKYEEMQALIKGMKFGQGVPW